MQGHPERLIGLYEGAERGPLLLLFGGIHGNEPAGVAAAAKVLEMLAAEPAKNPGFAYRGQVLALRGNLQALRRGQRFVDTDLNRHFRPDTLARLAAGEIRYAEDLEVADILAQVRQALDRYRPPRLVMLDVHTFTATGGIFSICTDAPDSAQLGQALHAPVLRGFLQGLSGTTLHQFSGPQMGLPCTGLSFEAGQHDDPLSVSRAISAIVNAMRAIGSVRPEDVENRHDELLRSYGRHLPKVAELRHVHRIRPGDGFAMRPGYHNFRPICQGEALADDRHGPILAPCAGHILMPLYQQQGEDGFFIVQSTEVPAGAEH